MAGAGLAAGDLVPAQDILVHLLFHFAPGIAPQAAIRSVDVLGLEGDAASNACESGRDGGSRNDPALGQGRKFSGDRLRTIASSRDGKGRDDQLIEDPLARFRAYLPEASHQAVPRGESVSRTALPWTDYPLARPGRGRALCSLLFVRRRLPRGLHLASGNRR